MAHIYVNVKELAEVSRLVKATCDTCDAEMRIVGDRPFQFVDGEVTLELVGGYARNAVFNGSLRANICSGCTAKIISLFPFLQEQLRRKQEEERRRKEQDANLLEL